MPRDPSDSTIQLTARLPSPSPYLAGSITTLDLSLAAHYWAVSAQVPSMMFGKAERRISSAAWAICTNNPHSTIRIAVRMRFHPQSGVVKRSVYQRGRAMGDNGNSGFVLASAMRWLNPDVRFTPKKRTSATHAGMSALCQTPFKTISTCQCPTCEITVATMEKRVGRTPSLRTKYVVAHTKRDHARRRTHCCKGLRSTAAPSRSHSGTEWRSGYVAKCCSKKTAGMNP